MRAITFAVAAALTLTACGKDEAADESRSGSNLTAAAIASNDVTAIDAVTGEAANMAADVELTENMGNALENAAEREAGVTRRAPAPARRSTNPPPVDQPEATPEPAADTANRP